MRALRILPLLAPMATVAHTASDAHVHGGDLASLLLLAVIAGIAIWVDRRWRR